VAVCADDIVVEMQHFECISGAFEGVYGGTEYPAKVLESSLAKVQKMMNRRRNTSAAVAARHKFRETVERCIAECFQSSIVINAQLWVMPQFYLPLLHIEWQINEVLRPYFSLELRGLVDGSPVTFLHPENLKDAETANALATSKLLVDWISFGRILMQTMKLDMIRQHMAAGMPPRGEDLAFAKVFRQTLVTGNVDMLPYITSGVPESRKREVPYHVYAAKNGFQCDSGCQCELDALFKGQREKAHRQLSSEEEELARRFSEFFDDLVLKTTLD
jgi:hypothetical protein